MEPVTNGVVPVHLWLPLIFFIVSNEDIELRDVMHILSIYEHNYLNSNILLKFVSNFYLENL